LLREPAGIEPVQRERADETRMYLPERSVPAGCGMAKSVTEERQSTASRNIFSACACRNVAQQAGLIPRYPQRNLDNNGRAPGF
jgi:hypothetical protein